MTFKLKSLAAFKEFLFLEWDFKYLVQVRVVDREVGVVHLKHLIWIAGLLVLMLVKIVVMLSVRGGDHLP